MPMQNALTSPLSWEDWFDQATEDASVFLWAAQSWLAPPPGYAPGYALALALAHRSRSCAAKERIQGAIPTEMAPWAASLDKILSRAESILARQVQEAAQEMQSVLNVQIVPMALALDNCLDRVLRLEEDCRLYEAWNDLSQDLREAAHEFLLRFSFFQHLKNGLLSPPLQSVESAPLLAAIMQVENRFRKSLDRFYPIQDLWPAFSAREYDANPWWLEKTPLAPDAQPDPLDEPLMAALAHCMTREAQTLDDYVAAQAIALGLEETPPDQESALLERLVLNSAAIDLMHDVKQAAREARTASNAPPAPAALARTMPQPSLAKKWLRNAGRAFSSLFPPRLAYAAAMACLALLLFIAMPLEKDSGRNDSSDAPEQASISLESQRPLGSLGLIARKSDNQLNRVSALGTSEPDAFSMEPGWSLESGDSLRVKASVDRDAFVHVIHIGPGKAAKTLFSGPVKAGQILEIPENGDWFVLDKRVGEESVVLVSGAGPADDLAAKLATMASAKDAARVFPGWDVRIFSFRHL